jgi:drug/metabolite transporter (DMT)-like permease
MVFYKLPSVKKVSRYNVSLWSLSTSLVLSIVLFSTKLSTTSNEMILIALLWGGSFLALSLNQMYALEHIETNILFPLTSILSLVFTIIIGFTFFKEQISFLQFIGVLLVIATVYLSIFKGFKLRFSNKLLTIGGFIIFFSTFNKVLQKLAADNVNIQAFQIFQYLFAVLFSFFAYSLIHRKSWKGDLFSGIKVGGAIGFFSFFGGYLLILALTKGPFTLVFSIFALYTLVTAIWGYFLFGENLTRRKVFLIIMAIIATLIIRLG